ncbi:MAG: serine hydrolase [Actinobacteria bacterium]|nr:serine hydrolase [Actinomycetota bacterium]
MEPTRPCARRSTRCARSWTRCWPGPSRWWRRSAANWPRASAGTGRWRCRSSPALWTYAGYQGYQSLADELGMTHTHLDEKKSDQWSWTWTTPQDQVLLARTLATGGSTALTDDECRFVWDLMGQVQDDQAWGVGKPRSATVSAHLKNGWVQFQSTDNLWAVNSMGGVQGDGRDYRMAVMTRVADFPTGREVTSEVGSWVFSILGSGKL